MKGWTKITTYNNLYEAEIKKQLLQNAGIDCVVINARDSLFLVGDIELYVKEDEAKKAQMMIKQFEGLTKINSFILKEPIVNFQDFLKSKGIETILKEKSSEKYILENYELYVNNDKIKEVLPYLTGENIEEWANIVVCNSVRQARYRVEILESEGIKSFIIKKRDSNYHLEDISIWVEKKNEDKAKHLITELPGWVMIKELKNDHDAELSENILGKNKIRGIIKKNNDKLELYVLEKHKEEAEKNLNLSAEWVELSRYDSFVDAEATLLVLENNGIDASIVTIRDSVFILGGYAVYVEKRNLKISIELLTKAKQKNIER